MVDTNRLDTDKTGYATRVEADVEALRRDVGTLRDDLQGDVKALRADVTRLLRDSAGGVGHLVSERGQRLLGVAQHQAGEHPLTLTLLAFGVGVSLGLLIGLRRPHAA